MPKNKGKYQEEKTGKMKRKEFEKELKRHSQFTLHKPNFSVTTGTSDELK